MQDENQHDSSFARRTVVNLFRTKEAFVFQQKVSVKAYTAHDTFFRNRWSFFFFIKEGKFFSLLFISRDSIILMLI